MTAAYIFRNIIIKLSVMERKKNERRGVIFISLGLKLEGQKRAAMKKDGAERLDNVFTMHVVYGSQAIWVKRGF